MTDKKKMYLFTFTWADGHVDNVVSTDTWTAQNHVHWERYGRHDTPDDERAELQSVDIMPVEVV